MLDQASAELLEKYERRLARGKWRYLLIGLAFTLTLAAGGLFLYQIYCTPQLRIMALSTDPMLRSLCGILEFTFFVFGLFSLLPLGISLLIWRNLPRAIEDLKSGKLRAPFPHLREADLLNFIPMFTLNFMPITLQFWDVSDALLPFMGMLITAAPVICWWGALLMTRLYRRMDAQERKAHRMKWRLAGAWLCALVVLPLALLQWSRVQEKAPTLPKATGSIR